MQPRLAGQTSVKVVAATTDAADAAAAAAVEGGQKGYSVGETVGQALAVGALIAFAAPLSEKQNKVKPKVRCLFSFFFLLLSSICRICFMAIFG